MLQVSSDMYPEGLSPPGSIFSVRCIPKRVHCTGKHRVWSPKHRLVRSIPETFKGLGLSQQTALCPQKAMLAGISSLLFRIAFTVCAEANASCFPKPHPYTFLLFQCKHLLHYRENFHPSIFATYLRCKKPPANSCLATILTFQVSEAWFLRRFFLKW